MKLITNENVGLEKVKEVFESAFIDSSWKPGDDKLKIPSSGIGITIDPRGKRYIELSCELGTLGVLMTDELKPKVVDYMYRKHRVTAVVKAYSISLYFSLMTAGGIPPKALVLAERDLIEAVNDLKYTLAFYEE